MKKILVFDKFLGYNVGGAQRSLHQLIKGLDRPCILIGCEAKRFNAQKHTVDQLQVERIGIRHIPRFPYLEYWLNRGSIRKCIMAHAADLLITQGIYGAIAARFFQGKIIYFVRDQYQLNSIPVVRRGIARCVTYLYLLLQLPFILVLFRDNRVAIQRADQVIANSEFIRQWLQEKFNTPSTVIYPLINLPKLERCSAQDTKREYITCIGSERVKGREVVERIARLFPNEQFMIVGREFAETKQIGNIRYEPWMKDVAHIYQKTKLLLVPSLWQEAFGRVAVEAGACNIPVIASNVGGLPEIVDKNLLVSDLTDPFAWQKKIKLVLDRYDYFVERNLRSLIHSDLFSKTKQIEKFNAVIDRV